MTPHNPFRAKAIAWRTKANAGAAPTSHDVGMTNAFPLGGGFGRGGRRTEQRLDATIAKAARSVHATQQAERFEQLADAFDAGTVDRQGRAIRAGDFSRRWKQAGVTLRRTQRIEAAKALVARLGRDRVSPEIWADACGYLRGSARALVISEFESSLRSASNSNSPEFQDSFPPQPDRTHE